MFLDKSPFGWYNIKGLFCEWYNYAYMKDSMIDRAAENLLASVYKH